MRVRLNEEEPKNQWKISRYQVMVVKRLETFGWLSVLGGGGRRLLLKSLLVRRDIACSAPVSAIGKVAAQWHRTDGGGGGDPDGRFVPGLDQAPVGILRGLSDYVFCLLIAFGPSRYCVACHGSTWKPLRQPTIELMVSVASLLTVAVEH